jgi:hypothetical protein
LSGMELFSLLLGGRRRCFERGLKRRERWLEQGIDEGWSIERESF